MLLHVLYLCLTQRNLASFFCVIISPPPSMHTPPYCPWTSGPEGGFFFLAPCRASDRASWEQVEA